jgi:Winged helix DNA-binding domain
MAVAHTALPTDPLGRAVVSVIVPTLTSAQLVAIRARNQLLAGQRPTSIAETVGRLRALQAQSTPAVRLSVRARSRHLTAAMFDEALAHTHAVVRTWLMRGTIFLALAEDIGWMTELVGPSVRARYRRRREQLGLTDTFCERALAALPEVLVEGRPVPLGQIMDELAGRGIVVDRSQQAPTHLMVLAATYGLVCRGPEAGREATFVLTDAWLPPGPRYEREESLTRLARLYLAGRGPATVADFGTWSGLPAGECRTAFAQVDDLVTVDVAGTTMVALAQTELAAPSSLPLRLIGMWDEYLLSQTSRDVIVDRQFADRVLVGGVIQSAVLRAGRVAGTWRLVGAGRRRRLVVDSFVRLPEPTSRAIAAEAADIGRFLEVDVEVDLLG